MNPQAHGDNMEGSKNWGVPISGAMKIYTSMKYIIVILLLLSSSNSFAQSTKEDCVQQGGVWGPVGLFPEPTCTLKTKDAGKACENSSECESSCMAPEDKHVGEKSKGTCYHKSHAAGTCLSRVENGVVTPRLCVD